MCFFGKPPAKQKEPLRVKTDIEIGEKVNLLGGRCLVEEVNIYNEKHEAYSDTRGNVVLLYKNNNGEYKRLVMQPDLFYSIRSKKG